MIPVIVPKRQNQSMTIRNAWYGIFVGVAVIAGSLGFDFGEGWVDNATAAGVGLFQIINGLNVWWGRKRVGDIL